MATRERRRAALGRQVARLEGRIGQLQAHSNRLSWARLGVFAGGFALSGLLFFLRGPLLWLPALTVWLGLFGFVVGIHRRVDAAIRRFTLWRDLKQGHLARMALDWAALPVPEVPPPPPGHPFAGDLDLTGERSLLQLVDTTVSLGARLRLQGWLMDADPVLEKVQRRQNLVRALRPLSLFRDRLTLQALLAHEQGGVQWKPQTLLAWLAHEPHEGANRAWVVALATLGVVNLALLLASVLFAAPPLWFVGVALYFLIYLLRGREAAHVFEEAMSLQDALQQLAVVFSFLERERFAGVKPLRELCAPFRRENRPPSQFLRRLGTVVAAAGLSRNPVLWLLLNVFFPWDFAFAYWLQQVRSEVASRLPGWLDLWFELEAASALANLAYLNPQYTFPHVALRRDDAAPFEARQIGHPLIPFGDKVCNHFRAGNLGEVQLITGSNMAGKSSFLRTVGINLCLAYAGGAVDAASLETDLFRLFTAIRVADSVTDGISYFYAEVKRLKALLAALEQDEERPLFFLIDEIFRGTNNRERLLGSRAYIRALVGQNGVGLIATHDLELVQLADEMPQVSNFHFRDFVESGRMRFDYRLRPGPSPTTNALKVMAVEGLPVPAEAGEQGREWSAGAGRRELENEPEE